MENNKLEKIQITEKELVVAFSEPPISRLNLSDCGKRIFASLILAIEYAGQKVNESDNGNATKFISKSVYEECKKQIPHIRIKQIEIAFRIGASGGFGQFFGINVNTCMNWIRAYLKSEENKKAQESYLKQQNEENEPQLTQEQKDKIMIEASLDYFNEYKKTKKIPYYSHSICDFLTKKVGQDIVINGKQIRTFVPDAKDRIEIRQQSEQEYKEWVSTSAKEYKLQGRIADAKNILTTLDNYKNLGHFKMFQKRNAVKWYFDKLINEGKDLMLNEIEKCL